ncbi:MAG: lipid-A-disaccharide synthase [Alphaproteobacteria bacterium]
MAVPLRLFIIAGEASGDALGAPLMAALREATGGEISFEGVGGPLMAEQGLDSLFPMSDLSVMGIAEIVPRLPLLLRRLRQTAAAVRATGPDAIVTIDAPEFCFGVLRRIGDRRAVRIHYVAPTVWAWRPWRAGKLARAIDHLMTLLPFEPTFFEQAGLAASFVGHPVVDGGAATADGVGFRAEAGIAPDARLLCVLPGSRMGEIARLLPPFGETVAALARRFPDLHVVLPTLPHLVGRVRQAVAGWPVPVMVTEDAAGRFGAMAASDVALAASGTVALELARCGTPSVIAYRVHPLTAAVVRRLVRVDYANLVNLLLDRPAVPELLQEHCRVDELTPALETLLTDETAQAAQLAACDEAIGLLSPAGMTPAAMAAETVLRVIRERQEN